MMKQTAAVASLVGLAVLAGCGSTPSDEASAPVSNATKPPASSSTAPASQGTASSSSESTATSSPKPSPATPASAEGVAQLVAGKKPGAKVVKFTEDNDPNHLLGRPSGYKEAANVQWLSCSDLGVECGATVEVWPNEKAALRRAKYIQSILQSSPALGSEYDYVQGPTLLRLAGSLKPSEVKNLNPLGGEPVTAD